MVVAAGADVVGWDIISIAIENRISVFVFLLVQWCCHINPLNGYTLDAYAFSLVEPNRILVEVCKGLLGISTIFFESLQKNVFNALVEHLIHL